MCSSARAFRTFRSARSPSASSTALARCTGTSPSKDDIFFALAEEGFRLLGDPSGQEEVPTAPLDRLRASFKQFYQFSCKHPQYFTLMFVDQSVPRISKEYERFAFAREKKRQVVQLIQACIDASDLPATLDPAVAFRAFSVGLIGVAVMRLSDRLQPGENADDLATDVLNVTLAGLRSGVTLKSKSSVDCPLEEHAADEKAS
ncbi:MAG: TetR/AcrR family transcriptional regulator [Acidobacteria bacterium]|nr:TetR/AcrR family transcriptional regulator [Acidobacteriota bacterium]